MSQERRRYSRFLVHPDEGEVRIQIGATVFPARVKDESCNGMHVILAATCPEVPEGAVVWLQTRAGCTEARVIRITREEQEIHLGLERLQDVPNLPCIHSNQPWWKRLPTFAQWDGSTTGVGLALVLCVCGAIYAAYLFTGAGASGVLGSGAPEKSAGKVQPQSFKSEAAGRPQGQMLQDLFQKLPAAQMVKELRLTPQQEVEFRAVLEAIHILQPTNASSENEMVRLCKAHERMLTVLSPSQLAYWKSTLEKQLGDLPAQGSTPADRQALLDRLFPKTQGSSAKPR